MKVYYSEAHRKHEPPFEIFAGGFRTAYMENPDRMDRILNALRGTDWADIAEPKDFGLDPIYAVHDKDYVDFLASAWTEWLASEAEDKSTLLPATIALRRHPPRPTSLLRRAAYYMMDPSVCIVEGTYPAALASANCALSAATVLTSGNRNRCTFALCRPPGHHAGKDYAGGYCFINNAAVAANWLSTNANVALLDMDYHCGNGTQDIFYERNDVLTISIHADPHFEYPYYAGYTDETGSGIGLGFHKNFSLEKGREDGRYLSVLEEARSFSAHSRIRTYLSGYLRGNGRLCRGSTWKDKSDNQRHRRDREADFRAWSANCQQSSSMEGGYNNEALGRNILAFLDQFA